MIKKADVLASLKKRDENSYRELSEKVAEALVKYEGNPVVVDMAGYRDEAVSRVQAEYSAPDSGWVVTFQGATQNAKGDKSGPFLTFS